MKQFSTTKNVSTTKKRFFKKAYLLFAVFLVAVAGSVSAVLPANARDYDAEIAELEQKISKYQAEASKLEDVANSLSQKVASLNLEKKQIQAELDKSQAEKERLEVEIKDTQQKILDNKDALGMIIADLYVDDEISPLEMLASSNNIGDYLDKQTQRAVVQDQLTQKIAEVKQLKIDLEQKKSDVEKVIANQKTARDKLAAKEEEQRTLLAQTQGKQSVYEKLSSEAEAARVKVREEQQAALAAAFAGAGATLIVGGLDGDYPWNDSNCYMGGPGGYYSYGGSDGNGGDGKGYGCRQCASYAAWRVAKETGVYPYAWGNATNFPASAMANGYQIGTTPQPGSLAVMSAWNNTGPEGHVGWVEAVNGGTVIISQYNYNYGAGYGMYSKMALPASLFDTYIYIQ